MAPRSNTEYQVNQVKKTMTIRPTPQSKIDDVGKEITTHKWEDVIQAESVDEKVLLFHNYTLSLLNKHFPEKQVKISN